MTPPNRHRDTVWHLDDVHLTPEAKQLAVLMDIRDELKQLNETSTLIYRKEPDMALTPHTDGKQVAQKYNRAISITTNLVAAVSFLVGCVLMYLLFRR